MNIGGKKPVDSGYFVGRRFVLLVQLYYDHFSVKELEM